MKNQKTVEQLNAERIELQGIVSKSSPSLHGHYGTIEQGEARIKSLSEFVERGHMEPERAEREIQTQRERIEHAQSQIPLIEEAHQKAEARLKEIAGTLSGSLEELVTALDSASKEVAELEAYSATLKSEIENLIQTGDPRDEKLSATIAHKQTQVSVCERKCEQRKHDLAQTESALPFAFEPRRIALSSECSKKSRAIVEKVRTLLSPLMEPGKEPGEHLLVLIAQHTRPARWIAGLEVSTTDFRHDAIGAVRKLLANEKAVSSLKLAL